MILTLLLSLTVLSFVLHVCLLLTSFKSTGIRKGRYFFSHFTLWLAGLLLCLIAWLYGGKGISPTLDVFASFNARVYIIVTTLALSLVAHAVVRLFVMPQYK